MSDEILAHLVFIHIEKAAGTSQRALLDQMYGCNNVLWRGRDFVGRRGRKLPDITRHPIIGGHLSAADFEDVRTPVLYLSIVRDPVSRAVSLFHYFSEHGPDKDRKEWRKKGLDPSSMTRTIQSVPAFRDAVSNRQCYRLSGMSDFEDTLDVLQRENYLIGTFERVDEFTDRVALLLGWPSVKAGRHNRARRSEYLEETLAEPGLEELILSINSEDEQLYRFVKGQIYFEHLPDVDTFQKYLSL